MNLKTLDILCIEAHFFHWLWREDNPHRLTKKLNLPTCRKKCFIKAIWSYLLNDVNIIKRKWVWETTVKKPRVSEGLWELVVVLWLHSTFRAVTCCLRKKIWLFIQSLSNNMAPQRKSLCLRDALVMLTWTKPTAVKTSPFSPRAKIQGDFCWCGITTAFTQKHWDLGQEGPWQVAAATHGPGSLKLLQKDLKMTATFLCSRLNPSPFLFLPCLVL